MSGGEDTDAAADTAGDSDELEIWRWVRETYFGPAIASREAQAPPEDALRDRAQVVFRFGYSPEVRFGREVRGQEVVESQLRVPGDADWVEDAEELDVSHFELPPEDSDAGHITAFSTSSGLDLTISGAAMAEEIRSELAAADEFLESAERARAGPLGPFANAAYPAAEMLARAGIAAIARSRLELSEDTPHGRSHYLWLSSATRTPASQPHLTSSRTGSGTQSTIGRNSPFPATRQLSVWRRSKKCEATPSRDQVGDC